MPSFPRLLAAFPEPSIDDRIVMAVFQILSGDETLRGIFGTNIYRRQVLRAPSSGAPWQLVVAPMSVTENGTSFGTARDKMQVGVWVVFEDMDAHNLDPDEPTVLSVLRYVTGLLDAASSQGLTVPPRNERLVKMHEWLPITTTPVQAGNNATLFAVGLYALYTYWTGYPDRSQLKNPNP